MATSSARMGNPTEPMTQGLLILSSSKIEPKKALFCFNILIICKCQNIKYCKKKQF